MPTSSDGPAISVRQIAKRYRLGGQLFNMNLRDRISGAGARLLGRGEKTETTEFWALRGVDLDIARGEVFGLIGRNGAGKSTLLKILSRITEPTSGEAHLRGRVATLLEVGTGFHPELSGRENIYLNGSILGMSRREIRARFDEIVAFAEVAKFLETPVKRYSSGMYVRLAFAVAAHLDPDILLVDEVLAVGDAEFQRKCLGKMRTISREGRTVVLVSHNMTVINQLCDRVAWLDHGELRRVGPSAKVIAEYLAQGRESNLEWRPAPRLDAFQVERVAIDQPDGDGTFRADEPIPIVIDAEVRGDSRPTHVALNVMSEEGVMVLVSLSSDGAAELNQAYAPGRHRLRCTIPGNLLKPGRYVINVWLPAGPAHEPFENILSFIVSEENCRVHDTRYGTVAPLLPWSDERQG